MRLGEVGARELANIAYCPERELHMTWLHTLVDFEIQENGEQFLICFHAYLFFRAYQFFTPTSVFRPSRVFKLINQTPPEADPSRSRLSYELFI